MGNHRRQDLHRAGATLYREIIVVRIYFMKKILILSFSALILVGCSGAAQTANVSTNAKQNVNDTAIVSSHSIDETKQLSEKSAVNSSGESSPMARAIDVTEMTADIEKAEKNFKKNPNDAKAKEALATAYFVRATALTGAAQYRAALGDYRKGLKLNPNDEAARQMHDQILTIFKSINREPPKEGEEPAPLPFKKEG